MRVGACCPLRIFVPPVQQLACLTGFRNNIFHAIRSFLSLQPSGCLYVFLDPLFPQLALHYPVDEDKGKAKFDKASKVLTITLPVLPPPPPEALPQTPLITPLEDDAPDQSVEDEPISVSAAPRAEERMGGGAGENQEEEDTESSLECPSADDAVTLEYSSPVTDSTVVTSWLRMGDWCCPPFSYRQEDTMVVFCLHTAQVKENSVVQYFDDHYVSQCKRHAFSFLPLFLFPFLGSSIL